MRASSYWLVSLALLALSAGLFLAPASFEGQKLIILNSRHAITAMDLVALIPLLAGGLVLIAGVSGRSRSLAATLDVPGGWLFVAGLALGAAVVARFPYLAVHWPLVMVLLVLVLIGVTMHAGRRS